MSKRKGVDVRSPDPNLSLQSSSWNEIKQCLERNQKTTYGWLDKLKSIQPECCLDEEHENLQRSADEVKTSLKNQISKARLACNEELSELSRLNEKIDLMEKEAEQIRNATADLREDEIKLQQHIQSHQNEASQYQVELNNEEIEMMKQVPKIKSQISLYAKTTGIKWDYSEQVLAGQVAIPSVGVVSRFSIDPRKHDSFHVANYLWSSMEGNIEAK
mmetsp:Transcript_14869/g.22874  ORF Transcript_14869/g.22874 Transcript_14869/m.22874 type:complete len:217 (-) Transcript_14869:223-873(-)|eukprot:CAMPEP_0194232160 /NCGR_PEP_ID=MMETSP0158-20130606/643_1 /TAXON_ID=33649 /ORGANISM="Thalassionema nitzschioides, Strain L26-B" /LENGTH=216 /DNA_ID=CAMNT_0038964889 /DNA_START=52 /DNA_END=702 /DNA_ORIENTATION=-